MAKKKKKQGRNLILGTVLLVALIAVYFGLDYQQKKEAASDVENEVLNLPVTVTDEEFAKVTIKTTENVLTFSREEKDGERVWTYEEDPKFPLNSTLVNTKMQSLTDPGITRILENPESISEYGLDDPSITITVEKTDGTSYKLLIGDKNATNNDYYLMVEGHDEIYTFDGSLVGALNIEPYDVATGEDLPTIEATSITNVKIEQESGTYEFVSDKETGLAWTMIAPDGMESAVDSTAIDNLKTEIAGIGFDTFVDYKGEDLAQYGLDEPQAVITIEAVETEVVEIEAETREDESGSETETEAEPETEIITTGTKIVLLVGDTTENGSYYVKSKDSPQVHLIGGSELETVLNIQRVDYVETYITDVPFTDVKSITVTYEGETREIVKEEEVIVVETEKASEGESEAETEAEPETEIDYHYMAGDTEYSSDYFIQFYNNSILLKAEKRMEEEDCPEVTGEPELILEYTRLNGEILKTEFYYGSDGMYLALSNHALPAKVDKFDVQAVIESYQRMLTDGAYTN